jgi:hypothetical protein
MTSTLAPKPGFGNSGNDKLSAIRVVDEPAFIRIVVSALRKNHGIVQRTAKALRCSRNTLSKWIVHYPELHIACEEARNRHLIHDGDEE